MPRRSRKNKHLNDEVVTSSRLVTPVVLARNGVVANLSDQRSSHSKDSENQDSSNLPNCAAMKNVELISSLESFPRTNDRENDQLGQLQAREINSSLVKGENFIENDETPKNEFCQKVHSLNNCCEAESDSPSDSSSNCADPPLQPSSLPILVGDCENELNNKHKLNVHDLCADTNCCIKHATLEEEEPNISVEETTKEILSSEKILVDEGVPDRKQVNTEVNVVADKTDDTFIVKSMSQIAILSETCRKQKEEIERISEENRLLHENVGSTALASSDMTVLAEETADIYEVQMAALEKTITQLQREVEALRDKLADQEDAANMTIAQFKRELGGKLDKATRQLEVILKEKESAVVKYAQSEATVLSLKKSIEDNERKFKEFVRERDTLLNKVRMLSTDKSRAAQALETKSSEVTSLQRENEKMREEISSKEIKIKWAQNRMKTEMDTHKETLGKLERTEQKLRETREEAEQVRRDCQEMIRTYQESEEIKSNSLDIQLKVKESELKMERQEKSTKEEVQQVLKHELESVKSKLKVCTDENNGLTIKLQTLERERLDYESNLGRVKEQSNFALQEIVDLQARLAEMDNLVVQINREKEKVLAGQTEIERLRQSNAELQIDMEACRRKEGELLEFTERLTAKNVFLQSEFSCLEAKCQALQRELPIIRTQCDELEQKNINLVSELTEEQELHKKETHLLARKLAEKTKAVEALNLKLEEQANDNRVLRRKNASTVRELSREIQSLRRRIDVHEANSRGNLDNHSLGSRASSTTSLDTLGQRDGPSNGPIVQQTTKLSSMPRDSHDRGEEVQILQPTQEMLIERIVKLQKAHARKNEKIEFLEEHVNQLVQELKKKSRLIQNYVLREDSGTLSTVTMDQHKLDVSRRGGIMASLYTSHQADNGLTLDLSLEISRKLQAVLEDTLLKNITLKENIKTLGDEIERLSMQRRQL